MIFVVIVYFLVERFFTYTEVTIKHDKNRIFYVRIERRVGKKKEKEGTERIRTTDLLFTRQAL